MTRIGHCGSGNCVCLQEGCTKCCNNCKVCNKDKNHYIDLPEEWLIAETEKLIADNKELFDRLAAS